MKRPVDFTSATNTAFGMPRREIARQHHADLVGEDLVALVVDHAAAVAVAVEAEARRRPCARRTASRDGVQHLHVFGVGIVAREGVVELRSRAAPPRSRSASRTCGAKAPAVPLPQAATTFRRRFSLGRSVSAFDVALGHVGHEDDSGRRPPVSQLPTSTISLSAVISSGPKVSGRCDAHLDAGPAVVVVAGRHHGDAFDLKLELGEVGHRRQREADVVHLAAAGQQAVDQRLLHGGRIGAVVVADDEALRDARARPNSVAMPRPDGVEPHEVDLLREQPARVVLAKAGRLDERQPLEVGGVRLQDRRAGGGACGRPSKRSGKACGRCKRRARVSRSCGHTTRGSMAANADRMIGAGE